MAFVLEIHIYGNIFDDPDYFILRLRPSSVSFLHTSSAQIIYPSLLSIHLHIYTLLALLALMNFDFTHRWKAAP